MDFAEFDSWWSDVRAVAASRGWRNMFHEADRTNFQDFNAGLSPAEAALKHIRRLE